MADSAPARRPVEGVDSSRDTPGSSASRDNTGPNTSLDGQSAGTPRSELGLPSRGDVEMDDPNSARQYFNSFRFPHNPDLPVL